MKLDRLVQNMYITTIGNRINPINYGLIGLGMSQPIGGHIFFDLAISATGLVGLWATKVGLGTLDLYEKTVSKLESKEIIDNSDINNALLEYRGNERFFGYCELQGVYLAAKKYNQTSQFRREKRLHTKIIIPNF